MITPQETAQRLLDELTTTEGGDYHLCNAAPDLAETVVALHAEVERWQGIAGRLDDSCIALAVNAERSDSEVVALHARLAKIEALFDGGPDTPCRTIYLTEKVLGEDITTELVTVPMADLRAVLDGKGNHEACCDMHNRHCEPPSELCCGECSEQFHGLWPPVEHQCVLDGEGNHA